MDIKFWKDIQDLGEKESLIRANFSLEYFNQVYENETSLFHYFANNVKVI